MSDNFTMLTRKRQLVAKIETVEGTAETLSASDGGILVNATPKANFEPQMYNRDLVRSSFTKLGKLTGKRAAGLEFAIELRGSGKVDIEPIWVKLIKACGFELKVIKKIAIGAISDGEFLHNEVIRSASNIFVVRAICNTPNGASILYFSDIDGTLVTNAEIVGDTSGASTTTTSAPEVVGFVVKPTSKPLTTLTMGLYEDGICKLLRGCRGTVKFSFKLGEPAIMEFSFMGVEAGVSDRPMLSDIVYEPVIPPVLLNARMSCDGVSLNIGEMEIDIANSLVTRDKIDDAKGILSYAITGRDMKGSFNPQMVSVSVHDFFGKWFSNTPMVLDLEYGVDTGNKFRVFAPKIVYNKVDDADRDGIQLANTSFDVTGSIEPGDDELSILLL